MGKKNILFICGHYAFPSAANSICVQNLAEEFIKEGHIVHVLAKAPEYSSELETINGVSVNKIFGNAYTKLSHSLNSHSGFLWRLLSKVVSWLRYVYILWFFPVTAPSDVPRIYRKAKQIIDNNSIDVVIATYMPYESIKVAMMLKKEYKEKIRVVTYHLDLLTDPNNESGSIVKTKIRKVQSAINKEFCIIDRILLPNTAPIINMGKIEYVDFPLYITDRIIKDEYVDESLFFDNKTINVAIVGSLDESNRNPDYICKLISALPSVNNKRVILHIWGKLSGVNLDAYSNVVYHGIAQVKDVPIILNNCDFLLNIGNKITYRMIPSKIFQMFAAKKPIIMSVSNEEDHSLSYFLRYRHVCMIHQYYNNESNDLKKLHSFVKENIDSIIDVDDQLFEKSTPKYICNKILDK